MALFLKAMTGFDLKLPPQTQANYFKAGQNSKGNRLQNIYEVLGSTTHVIIYYLRFLI